MRGVPDDKQCGRWKSGAYASYFRFVFFDNKFQALQEKEKRFGSLDHQSCIGPTEAQAAILDGSTLTLKIGMSISCGLGSGVRVGSSLMRCSKVNSSPVLHQITC